jgi:hypothetical protein
MPDFELRLPRRARGARQRGLSGLGLLVVAAGLLVLAIAFSPLPPWIARLWPLVLVAVGLFGVFRPAGMVAELDVLASAGAGRAGRGQERPRRLFSLLLIVAGCLCLLFTTGLVDARVIGPAALFALGLLLVWRRGR